MQSNQTKYDRGTTLTAGEGENEQADIPADSTDRPTGLPPFLGPYILLVSRADQTGHAGGSRWDLED